MNTEELRASLRHNVPPQMREAYDKIVTAGMKIMFDKSTHRFMQQQIAAPGPIDEKLAAGIAGLIATMVKNAHGAFPTHLIIPAGIELMMHAADYMSETGAGEVTPDILGQAMQKFIFALFEKGGVSPDQLLGSVDKMAELQQQGAK